MELATVQQEIVWLGCFRTTLRLGFVTACAFWRLASFWCSQKLQRNGFTKSRMWRPGNAEGLWDLQLKYSWLWFSINPEQVSGAGEPSYHAANVRSVQQNIYHVYAKWYKCSGICTSKVKYAAHRVAQRRASRRDVEVSLENAADKGHRIRNVLLQFR